ncbi:MAG TPA: phenylalanine--tRNA ligase subunit beta [Chloroflexota bacterium]|jgi:phenylalanyl-tRNA synthetase beta chain|nr:phenylalanine--tRNA ligase subunit beta [Chloroflexota bacterium]
MRVSLKWLRDYLDVALPADELARRLTMAGIEVEDIHYLGGAWEHVWVARIESIEPHPNADRLTLVTASYGGDNGASRRQRVVTGATNIKAGDVVPLGLVGTRYRDGHVPPGAPPQERVLQPTTMRGVVSEGMVMSGYELGLSDDHSGILVLPPDTPVGLPLAEALGDTVIQLDLKGRADCLAMIGVAREVGALTAVRPTITVAEPQPARERRPDEPVRIEIAAPDLCARFTAVLLKGVKIGPSPAWMQERLQAAGVRPINNVVDVTNFVMLEWGQPLHAYDYDRVRGGTLIARRARPGEVLLTLAAERPELELSPDQLVIADAERAVGLAGVIGGADTEVTEGTTAVLLEAANFLPVAIRRTARAFLPRPTEASRRFERGIPPEHTVPAALRAAQLIVELAGAELIGAPVDVYPQPRRRPVIRLNPGELERLIGVPYSTETIEGVFDRLGFMYEQPGPATGGDYLVHAPVWRLDVERPADLVEEVVRIDGYEKIPTTLMRGEPPMPQSNPTLQWEEAVRDVLVGAGFAGLLTYPLISRQRLARLPHMDGRDAAGRLAALVDDRIAPPIEPVTLANPASQDQDVLRTSGVPSLLEALGANLRHADRDVHLFELARVYLRDGAAPAADLPEERRVLTFVTGAFRSAAADWGRQENDFYYVKAVAEAVLERMGISGHGYVAVQHPAFHPYQAAAVVLNHRPEAAGKKPVQPQEVLGIVGRLDETTAGAFDIKQRAFVVALDFDRLVEHAAPGRGYTPLPRTPAVIEDFSFLLARSTPAERLVASIQRAGAPLVESVTLKGIYGGEGIPEGYRSLTYTVVYRAPDHTLTADEVSAVRARIVQAAERQTGAKLRS